MKNFILLLLLVLIFQLGAFSQNPSSENYLKLKTELCKGWNTWATDNLIQQVLLPEGLAFRIGLKATAIDRWGKFYMNTANTSIYERPEKTTIGLRSISGSYTEVDIEWSDYKFKVETALDGGDILFLVTPLDAQKFPAHVVLESGFLWNRPGTLSFQKNKIVAQTSLSTIEVHTTGQLITNDFAPCSTPYLITGNKGKTGFYTGKSRSLEEVEKTVSQKRTELLSKAKNYGQLSDAWLAMSTVLGVSTIYDPENDRVITPISRAWSQYMNGWVLAGWDNFFASYMLTLFNQKLAMANAIEILKSGMVKEGFLAYISQACGQKTYDRSAQPLGSYLIYQIYQQKPEKWFLEEVYADLLLWNRWWPNHRSTKGFLCWGSNPVADSIPSYSANTKQGAAFEAGLDNSPMWDGVPFNTTTHLMEQADVGLMSFYVLDCQSLAKIAEILGKPKDATELKERGKNFENRLKLMWSGKAGVFLNRSTNTGELLPRLSPTLFYPMLTATASTIQAKTMVNNHLLNPTEFWGEWVIPSIARNDTAFKDNFYWRGRIWPPMNTLVYLGLRNYANDDVKKKLADKSLTLFMKNWNNGHWCWENYNAVTGEGKGIRNNASDNFYHWGALLPFISFIEEGYVKAYNVNK